MFAPYYRSLTTLPTMVNKPIKYCDFPWSQEAVAAKKDNLEFYSRPQIECYTSNCCIMYIILPFPSLSTAIT